MNARLSITWVSTLVMAMSGTAVAQEDILSVLPRRAPWGDYCGARHTATMVVSYPATVGPAVEVRFRELSAPIVKQLLIDDVRHVVIESPIADSTIASCDFVDVTVEGLYGTAFKPAAVKYCSSTDVGVSVLYSSTSGGGVARYWATEGSYLYGVSVDGVAATIVGNNTGCSGCSCYTYQDFVIPPHAPGPVGVQGVHGGGWGGCCEPYHPYNVRPLAMMIYGSPPGAPLIVSSVPGSEAASLHLEYPDPGHDAVTDVEVQFNLEGDWISLGSPGPAVEIGGLTNGNAYFIRVRARNLFGSGPPSDPIQVVPSDCNVLAAEASSIEFTADGSVGDLSVVQSAFNCSTVASSTVDWIVFDNGGVASGASSQLGFTVAANTTASVRAGVIVIGGELISIVQHAAEVCSGDLNGDGIVTGSDIGLLLLQWGPCD